MRFTAVFLSVLSASSAAAAVAREAVSERSASAEAAADPFGTLCLFHGQGCWKREAAPEALPEPAAEAAADPFGTLCRFHGQGCWKVRRAANAFAEVVDSEPETRSVAEVGSAAYNAKRATEAIAAKLTARAADPDASPFGTLCRFHGQGCWKRDAAPAPAAEPFGTLCLFHGQGCWKRDASPSLDVAAEKRECNKPGQACDVARRAAEALLSEIESFPSATKRSVDYFGELPVEKREAIKEVFARCNAPGAACNNAERDIVELQNAARSVLDFVN